MQGAVLFTFGQSRREMEKKERDLLLREKKMIEKKEKDGVFLKVS